jgi:ActR/RegA family two-component response regulator
VIEEAAGVSKFKLRRRLEAQGLAVDTASSGQEALNYLKANAPFWKREESPKGTNWIEAHGHDDDAAARWTKS